MRLNRILWTFLLTLAVAQNAIGQYKSILVEEVENEGKVPGKTYRVYAVLTNRNDQVFMVFGEADHPLEITSTKPFFQSSLGGPLSRDSNRKIASMNDSLKFDSWLTIGATDNYDNNLAVLNLDLKTFEEKGGSIKTTDGAWYCIPTDLQVFCKDDKKLLLMQFTTAGVVSGKINLMGRTAAGENYIERGVHFSTK